MTSKSDNPDKGKLYLSPSFAIMASGTGTNALALIDHGIEIGRPPACLIVNREDSPLLKSGPERSIPTFYVPAKKKGIDEEFENKVIEICKRYSVSTLFLAGFMKILGPNFLEYFKVDEHQGLFRVINIHPSLLPKYPGLGGYEKAYNEGDREFGHTLHLVNTGVDEGPILYQKIMKREDGETLEDMMNRGKKEENLSYQKLLQYLTKEPLEYVIEDHSLFVKRVDLDQMTLINYGELYE
ncbi:MAG: hypothetical protein CME60_00805 [Halobacteriovoraceae bacterium]|nr:hypothetical protein [Halobacteriovoraceae bacterium]